MAWWNTKTTEPYRQFRFLVQFSITSAAGDGAAGKNLHFFAMKVDKPMFKVGEYNHKFLNHQFNYPGRLAWDPVTITMVDIQSKGSNGPVQHELMREYVRRSGYPRSPAGEDAKAGTDGISKASAVGSLGDITITQLKPTGNAGPGGMEDIKTHENGQVWTLKNAFLTDIKFGSLDYGSEDAVQITMTVRYGHAKPS